LADSTVSDLCGAGFTCLYIPGMDTLTELLPTSLSAPLPTAVID
jgi:hypothetical protein